MLCSFNHFPLLQSIFDVNQIINSAILSDIEQEKQKTNLISFTAKNSSDSTLKK